MILEAETILSIAAVITAIAGLVKAFVSSEDVKKLRLQVDRQAQRILALEQENAQLKLELDKQCQENRELKDQNTVLAGVNEEYRKQLLPALRHR